MYRGIRMGESRMIDVMGWDVTGCDSITQSHRGQGL